MLPDEKQTADLKRQRNAVSKQKERARKKQAGLKRLELWAPPKLHPKIKTYVRKLLISCNINKLDKG